jgi:hypothetical protein
LIELSHAYKFEKKYKESFDINEGLINKQNYNNEGRISGELVDLAIILNDKEALLKYLPKVEEYWRSNLSKGYEWSGILTTLINAYDYLNDTLKELSYLCTAYIQSYKGEGWFEMRHTPSTIDRIFILSNKIKKSTKKEIFTKDENIEIVSAYADLCIESLFKDVKSTESINCKKTLRILGFNEKVINNMSLDYFLYPSKFKGSSSYQFCERLSIKQAAR